MRDHIDSEPIMQNWYAGMRIMLTINRDKDEGFVNGMEAEIVRREGVGFTVVDVLGAEHNVYPMTDRHYRTFYPMRPAYAVNLSKMQGETLEHITLWLDTPHVPAAMYMALSRVRRLEDIVFLGTVTTRHIRPSRYV